MMQATGCGNNETEIATAGDAIAKLRELSETGPQNTRWPVADHVAGAWDTVHHFLPGTTWEQIRETVGAGSFPGEHGRYDNRGALLVFTGEGNVVHAMTALPPLFVSSTGRSFSREAAMLRAHSDDPGPYLLMLESK